MARKSRKPSLALPTVAHKRFSYEVRTGQSGRAGAIAFKAFLIYDGEGFHPAVIRS
jgi:hypothetical protein